MRVVAAEHAAQVSGKTEGAQMTSVALSIRQPTLNPTRKEITTRKWQELPVQQASLGTALSPGVVRKEKVEDAQPDVLRARIAQKVCGVEDDGCDMGGDDGVSISFNYGVSGAAGQASAAGRGTRGRRVRGGRGGRTARRAASTASAEGDACV
ncbi:hypothetical protein PI124_g16915 [Phytophthora idaei]|nr:hypothetical protein PI124_g16915 [Phytophthora idaei]